MLDDVLGGPSDITRHLNRLLAVREKPHPLAVAPPNTTKLVTQDVPQGGQKRPVQQWVLRPVIAGGVGWPRWQKKEAPAEPPPTLPATVRERFAPLLYDDQTYVTQLAASTPPEWTKEETDYLFGLALDLDLRWPVIYDRYRWPPPQPQMDESEPQEEDEGDEQRPSKDLEALKHRFYSVCSLMSQYVARNDDDKMLKLGNLAFDPVAERQRKERLETRYEVNASSRENRLKDLVILLQDRLKELAEMPQASAPPVVPPHLNDMTDDLFKDTGEDFAVDEYKRIEQSLLPIRNAASAVYRGRGVALASSLIRQNPEGLFHSVAPSTKTNGTGSSAAGQRSGSSVGKDAGIEKPVVNAREFNDSFHKTLKTVLNESSAVGIPGGVLAVTSEETRININPKQYFAQGFLPPVNSRETLEAYTTLRIEAALLYQLTKERDHLSQIYDLWVNRLMDLRKGLRNSRRSAPRPAAPPSRDPTSKWRTIR
eukprot:Protomagalhaensia_sp_Gyna_25__1391@NODE_1700_length_1608_cov_5_239006_g1393_i0_p1_GENE_NODE_1700_length_1608_cov_5_239006_g1393_i0NODE_1700_length_1608_cov_5_239006_g1393_i0_p1_ORF_typecomplete_len491_score80_38SANT_DAMP1_like/PF16282_5/1_1e17_NODE_1700_length_1608_cov_5_239006_g1393_i01361584